MSKIRVAAVQYLNALPLVRGLDAQSDLFDVQYDVPARCAALLHAGTADLALIPSIEYLQRPNYRIVAGRCGRVDRSGRIRGAVQPASGHGHPFPLRSTRVRARR